MPRQNEYGKYVLSAGEIGSYTVCPESWRLSYVDKVEQASSLETKTGRKLHTTWAAEVEEAAFLSRYLRLVLYAVSLAVAAFLLL